MEQENFTQKEAPAEQKIQHINPFTKYLAIFVFLSFISGYIGYSYAYKKITRTNTVPQTITTQTDITKLEFDSVISEINGGTRNIDSYLTEYEDEVKIMNQLKNERYAGSIDNNKLNSFMITLNNLVEKEDFKTVATFIPKQGFFYVLATETNPIPNRSQISSSQIWTKDQVATLLPSKRFEELTKDVIQTNIFELNPVRLFKIYFEEHDKTPTANDFKCTQVTNEIEVEDILMLGIQNRLHGGGPEKRDVKFANHFYSCDSGWGGIGMKIYIQQSQKDGNPEIIGAIGSYWE